MTQKTMSSLSEQLRAQGVDPDTIQFHIAAQKYRNANRTEDEAHAVVTAVFAPIVGAQSTAIDTNPPPSDVPTYPVRKHRRHSRWTPGHARRGAAAINATAQSLFDTYRLPDGRTLREVRWCDAPGLAARYNHHARVLMACHNFAQPVDETATLDTVVSAAELQTILTASDRFHVTN